MKKYSILIIILIIIILSIIDTPYYLVIPGQGLELAKYVSTENGEKDAKGRFLLTSTSLTKANILLYLYSFLDNHIELMEIDGNLDEHISTEEYLAIMDKMMKESQMIAKIVALEKAGYFPKIVERGVKVNNILDKSSAKGRLIPGDIITKINKTPVRNISDFSTCIEQFHIGEIIKIYFQRNESLYSTKIPIIDISRENSKEKISGIGFFLTEGEIQCQFPLEIIIDLEGIKGSSAGLMIALEILNQLTENDLSNGLIIAGTGILDIDGNIKPVDGIRQKVISAKKNKADLFFIPKQNYQEAVRYTKNIKIIPVENFDEVIMKLIKL